MVACLLWSVLVFLRSDATPAPDVQNVPYVTSHSSGYSALEEKRKHNKSSLFSLHIAVSATGYVRNARYSVFRREYIVCYPVSKLL
ncbi:hypothetical protein EDD16DRAFT_1616412, partial [Pisolithus croceorrhizus]